jgi:hypothetical protein
MDNKIFSHRVRAATTIQKAARGFLIRKKTAIRDLGLGVIHARIRGDENVFARIGIEIDPRRDSFGQSFPRRVDVLSIDRSRFTSSMVGGHQHFNPIAASNESRREILGSAQKNVYVDGGYYNSRARHKGHPGYQPIGPTRTLHTSSYVPTPSNYVKDYETIHGDDGTYLSSAPVVTREGKNVFPRSKLKEPKYNYDTVRWGPVYQIPGELFHMSDPNPRAGIAFARNNEAASFTPSNATPKQDRYRIATATTLHSRGEKNDGFTMGEWAEIMTRLSQINVNPGDAINLDSGGSVVMGTTDREGNRIFTVAQRAEGRDASTMIRFCSKGEGE